MKVYVYGDYDVPVVRACHEVLRTTGAEWTATLDSADVAIAPLLTKKLSLEEIGRPRLGTLIFHPSLLPRHRGRDAIKWAFRLGEQYTGATWFWADAGLDTGDICEQEVLAIRAGEVPREFYSRAVIPACARMLGYILADLSAGIVRRRPQLEENATYEPPVTAK